MWKCVCVCVSPASSGPVSVDNVVLKATCSLSAYKYLPPLLVDHSTNASGEKHVLLLWALLSRSYMLFMSAPSAVTARLLRVCVVIHQQWRQMELTGQLWHHDLGLWMDVWPIWSRHRQILIHTEITGRDWTHTCYTHTQSLTATNQNSFHASFNKWKIVSNLVYGCL